MKPKLLLLNPLDSPEKCAEHVEIDARLISMNEVQINETENRCKGVVQSNSILCLPSRLWRGHWGFGIRNICLGVACKNSYTP
jgi:hypothetical protein